MQQQPYCPAGMAFAKGNDELFATIANVDFSGVTGPVNFLPNGDRLPTVVLSYLPNGDRLPTVVLSYLPNGDRLPTVVLSYLPDGDRLPTVVLSYLACTRATNKECVGPGLGSCPHSKERQREVHARGRQHTSRHRAAWLLARPCCGRVRWFAATTRCAGRTQPAFPARCCSDSTRLS
eukprot:g43649.t1